MKAEKIAAMIAQIETIITEAEKYEQERADLLNKVHPKYKESAVNLLHYRTLRLHDIRDLQNRLAHLGMSRLGKAESHVMASLKASKSILEGFISEGKIEPLDVEMSIKKGDKTLVNNTKKLLGSESEGRNVRIMVTQPSESAQNKELVYDIVKAGMDTARINCAHDDKETWKTMIENIQQASTAIGKNCKISMDLGGPKIRTGAIEQGPRVLKFSPKRNLLGEVISPAIVTLFSEQKSVDGIQNQIPVSQTFFEQLSIGDTITLKDTRGKKRKLTVADVTPEEAVLHSEKTIYFQTGLELKVNKADKTFQSEVGVLPPLEMAISLNIGDTIFLHAEQKLGKSATYDDAGNLTAAAHLSCTSKKVFEFVKAGERILFDDGKIEGIIQEVSSKEMRIEILHTKPNGGKLKADKGINFPNSQLGISGLTDKDRIDLEFVAKEADVVNMSFVNTASDVEDLLSTLERLEAKDDIGIILKIETQSGFNHLTEILLTAMQTYPVGVMIARGDLAIESGWENIGRIQEEMLSLCQAAHIPVVWATQVLENLAKTGIPSRAEITDAAMAQRAECVMLNKGPHIVQAIGLLDTILKNMKAYQVKKSPMLPALEKANA